MKMRMTMAMKMSKDVEEYGYDDAAEHRMATAWRRHGNSMATAWYCVCVLRAGVFIICGLPRNLVVRSVLGTP